MDTLVGINLGGYTLLRVLGSGGMGTVYLAEDKAIGQQVAIKVVHSEDNELSETPSQGRATERFRQEARAVASLDHLHILPLYRYGEDESGGSRRAYIIMQYRPEGSLWDWLRRRSGSSSSESLAAIARSSLPPQGLPTSWPLGLDEATSYLTQAASALQYAHDRGIVHRDVKPANFLLRFDQQGNESSAFLLLSDFGLAKFFSSVSATSHVFGTPLYMAPEQFEGTAGPECDQYSLAIMIYYFLAGRPPFMGEPMRLMNQHLSAPPPPLRTFAPTLPAGIEEVLARALSKNPGDRYPSIVTFADTFLERMHKAPQAFVTPLSLPTRLPGQQSQPSRPYPALQQADQLTEHSAPTLVSQTPLPPTPGAPTLYPPSATPGGRAISAFPAHPHSSPGYVTQRQSQHASLSTPPPTQRVSRRSTLGLLLGGIAALGVGAGAAGIYLYQNRASPAQYQPQPTATTAPLQTPTRMPSLIKYRLIGHSDTVTGLSWSPDGILLVSGSLDHTARLWLISAQRTTMTYTGHSQGLLTIAWSPDGRLIASGGRDMTVQVWNTSGTPRLHSGNQGALVESTAWLVDSANLLYGTLGRGAREILLTRNKTLALPVGNRAVIRTLAVAPRGRSVAIGAEDGAVAIYDLPQFHRILNSPVHTGSVRALAWSPDGSMVASGGITKTVHVWDSARGNTLYQLPLPTSINAIAWAPDGSGRVAIATEAETLHIWNPTTDAHSTYQGHVRAITSLAWGKGGLASGSADKTIIVWNV